MTFEEISERFKERKVWYYGYQVILASAVFYCAFSERVEAMLGLVIGFLVCHRMDSLLMDTNEEMRTALLDANQAMQQEIERLRKED